MLKILLFALVSSSALASEIVYVNGRQFFSAAKNQTNFLFSDKLGSRELKVQDCNKVAIEKFWDDLEENIKIWSREKKSTTKAWVKSEGLQFSITAQEGLSFFDGIPSKSHALFAASHRLCKK